MDTHTASAPALHAATEGVRLHTCILPLAAHAAGAGAEGPIAAEIIPPPGPGGCIEGADGRRQYAPDMAALAAAIAAQPVQPRIDRDHTSERTSPTFNGSTEARGWVRSPRVNARGGIDADLHLDADTRAAVGRDAYRYLSPALRLDTEERITGLSSIALVNDPNLNLVPLRPHNEEVMDRSASTTRADTADSAPDPQVEEARRLMSELATETVDLAVEDGRILPRDRDYHLAAITSHSGGVRAGIAAFRAHVAGAVEGAGGGSEERQGGQTKTLMSRTGPRGAPPGRTGAPGVPAFQGPIDVLPPTPERLALHANIIEHAKTHGISYRDAVQVFGALGLDRT